MPRLSAICNTCDTVFEAPVNLFHAEVSIKNFKIGPCPTCGGDGSILDGTYSVDEKTIALLSGPQATIDRLEKLHGILLAAKEEELPRDELARQVRAEVPELSSLSSLIPQTRNELYAFLGLLIALVSLVVSLKTNNSQGGLSQEDLANIIRQHNGASAATLAPSRREDSGMSDQKSGFGKSRHYAVPRGAPCPCGSGKKYKKCCDSRTPSPAQRLMRT